MDDSTQQHIMARGFIFLLGLIIIGVGYWALKKKWQSGFLLTQFETIAFALAVMALLVITMLYS